MPYVDQHGDRHPAPADAYNLENDALHIICCTACQQNFPRLWKVIQNLEAEPNHGI